MWLRSTPLWTGFTDPLLKLPALPTRIILVPMRNRTSCVSVFAAAMLLIQQALPHATSTSPILNWCPLRESNSQPLITKQLLCHLTKRALLVDPKRIELLLSPCKGDMLPLSSRARYWHQCKDLNPDKRFWRPLCYRYTTLI